MEPNVLDTTSTTTYEAGLTLLNEFYEEGIQGVLMGLADLAPHIGRYIIESYGESFSNPTLTYQQREMVTLATLISLGDCASQLKWHIYFSLSIGIIPEAIIEVMTHCIPFSGFPRTLQAIQCARQVFTEHGITAQITDELQSETSSKYERGLAKIEELEGEHGKVVLESLDRIAPKLGERIVGFTFGEVYSRSILNAQERQLITIGSLTALGSCEPQLHVHIPTALRVGLTKEQVIEAFLQCAVYVGFPKVINGIRVLQSIPASEA